MPRSAQKTYGSCTGYSIRYRAPSHPHPHQTIVANNVLRAAIVTGSPPGRAYKKHASNRPARSTHDGESYCYLLAHFIHEATAHPPLSALRTHEMSGEARGFDSNGCSAMRCRFRSVSESEFRDRYPAWARHFRVRPRSGGAALPEHRAEGERDLLKAAAERKRDRQMDNHAAHGAIDPRAEL